MTRHVTERHTVTPRINECWLHNFLFHLCDWPIFLLKFVVSLGVVLLNAATVRQLLRPSGAAHTMHR